MPVESMFCYLSIIGKYPSDYLSVAKLGSIFNTMKDYEGGNCPDRSIPPDGQHQCRSEPSKRTGVLSAQRISHRHQTLSGSDRPGRQHTADMLLPGSQLLRYERILSSARLAAQSKIMPVTRRQPTLLFGTFVLQDIMETRGNRISEPGYRPDYPRRQYHGALILRLGRLLQANQANPGPNQGYQRTIQICP